MFEVGEPIDEALWYFTCNLTLLTLKGLLSLVTTTHEQEQIVCIANLERSTFYFKTNTIVCCFMEALTVYEFPFGLQVSHVWPAERCPVERPSCLYTP